MADEGKGSAGDQASQTMQGNLQHTRALEEAYNPETIITVVADLQKGFNPAPIVQAVQQVTQGAPPAAPAGPTPPPATNQSDRG